MLETLYTCIALDGNPTQLEAEIRLNDAHPVFEGHFPGRPILPGVCQLQIIKELVEKHLGKRVSIRSIRDLKFLSPVLPPDDNRLRISLSLAPGVDSSIIVRGSISAQSVQKTKIKATFAY